MRSEANQNADIVPDRASAIRQHLRAIEVLLDGLGGGVVEVVDEYAAKIARSLPVPKYAERVNMSERRIWAWISSDPPKIVSFKTHGGRRMIDPEDNPVQ